VSEFIYVVLEMTARCTMICLMPFKPSVSSRIDNVLVRTVPELNQPRKWKLRSESGGTLPDVA